MTDKLKPCPFCGGPAVVSEYNGGFASVGCGGLCSFKPHAFGFPSVDSAIEAWNTRAERTCRPTPVYNTIFECDVCGEIDTD